MNNVSIFSNHLFICKDKSLRLLLSITQLPRLLTMRNPGGFFMPNQYCHSRENGSLVLNWIPAFAGMTTSGFNN